MVSTMMLLSPALRSLYCNAPGQQLYTFQARPADWLLFGSPSPPADHLVTGCLCTRMMALHRKSSLKPVFPLPQFTAKTRLNHSYCGELGNMKRPRTSCNGPTSD